MSHGAVGGSVAIPRQARDDEGGRGTVRVAGCEVSVLRFGRGTPTLVLHGFEPFDDASPFLGALAEHVEVIAPDHPGYGASSTPPWLDTIQDLVFFYREFVAALGFERVNVVGHGLGGWIALELAMRSAVVRSLVLIDSAGMVVKGVDGIDTFMCTAEQLHRAGFADPALAEASMVPASERAVELQLKNGLSNALLGWQPRFHDPHLRKWIHQLDVPTLVLWGADDRIFPPAYGAELSRLIDGARLTVFDDCGYAAPIERPADIAAAVGAFLEEVAR